ncbi:hypothetical protein [Halosimplex halobium]|uniref:hypothetical protein n=1 Tax=Halosimplex halobium TaxID=3396618 RepID=UPI003F553F8B
MIGRQIGDRNRNGETQNILLAVGALSLAVTCLFLALVPPATTYETSLVNAYPPLFWLSFAVGLTVVVTVFAVSAVAGSSHWRYAFGLLAAFYAVFFFLPVHRGYRLYGRGGSDTIAHLGTVKAGLATESIDVFYPLEHLVVAELSMLGVPLTISRHLLPLVFTLLFVGSVGILVRTFIGRRYVIGGGLCAATPLVFTYQQIQILPFLQSLLLFPLVVFLLERTRQTDDPRYRLSYVVLGVGIAFFHPVTAVFLVILVVSTVLFGRAYDWYERGKTWSVSTRLAPLSAVVIVWWYSSFDRTSMAVSKVVGAFSRGHQTPMTAQTQQAATADFTILQLFQRTTAKYGMIFLVLGIGGLYSLTVLYRVSRHDQRYPETYATLQYAIGGSLAVLFLVTYLIAFDPVRVSRYFVFGAVLLVGLLLARASLPWRREGQSISVSGRALILPVVVVCVLMAALLGSFAGTTYWPNKQMTHAEYEGVEFLLSHNDPSVEVHAHSLHPKTQWYVTGNRSVPGHPPAFNEGSTIPRHLGYDRNDTAGRTFSRAYLVTQAYDREYYRASYFTPEQRRALFVYDRSALDRLQRDHTAGRVYTNGGFSVWDVNPAREVDDR